MTPKSAGVKKKAGRRRPATAPRPAGAKGLAIDRNLTIYEAGALKGELLGLVAAGGEVALDLSGVTEIDAAGLQVLLLAQRESAVRGGSLRIDRASPAVEEILQLLGLSVRFEPAPFPLPAA